MSMRPRKNGKMEKTPHHLKTAKNFIVELYEEDESMSFAFQSLFAGAYDAVWCKHDKDVREDGTSKKEHWHFVIHFEYKPNVQSVAKDLHINPCYVDTCESLNKSLIYLIHRGWPDKYQYDRDEVGGTGSLLSKFKKLTDDFTEDDKALKILALLQGIERPIKMKEFISMCAKEGLFADLRRGGYLFVQMLKEHNAEYVGMPYYED